MFWLEILLVLVVVIGSRVLTLDGYFITNDETLYWQRANQFVNALLNQDWAATLMIGAYPSVTVAWVQVIGFAVHWLWAWLSGYLSPEFYYQLALDRPLEFALLAQRRLSMALANAGTVVLIYLYVRRLFGRWIALVSVLLIGLAPSYLSDALTMRGDSLMSGLLTLSVLSLILAICWERPRAAPNWSNLTLSAMTAGLALLTKVSALPIVIFGGLIFVGQGVWVARSTGNATLGTRVHDFWQAGLKPMTAWLAVIALTCFVLWPALWVSPDKVWSALFDGQTNYFMGQISQTDLLPLFYPITFFFHATPLTLIGLALLLPAFVNFMRSKRTINWPKLVPSLLLVTYCLVYLGLMTVGLLKRYYYLLPIWPASLVLSSMGWVWLANQVQQRWLVYRPVNTQLAMWSLAVGVMLTVQIIQIVPIYPYYYSYWNPIAGKEFIPYFELITGGLDRGLAAQWLNAQPHAEQLKVALRPSLREFTPLFKGETIPFTNASSWVQADFIIVRRFHLQLNEYSANQLAYLAHFSPVYTMTQNGVTL